MAFLHRNISVPGAWHARTLSCPLLERGSAFDSRLRMKHAEFHISYIWVALATALGAGFALGAYMALAMGYGLPFGPAFGSLIQTHGHLQLVGWAGVFIMGVSLYFLPRLAGVPLARPQWCTGILGLMAAGLCLRSIGQTVLIVLRTPLLGLWLLTGSGFLEWCGILLYVCLLLGTMRGREGGRGRPALLAVRPYVGMMVGGWSVYACLNLLLLLHMALRRSVAVHQGWHAFAVEVFIGLVLLPVALAFSMRTFPLYLRLAVPDWPVRGTAYAYLCAWCLHVLPTAPVVFGLAPSAALALAHLGLICKGGIILWFVWKLDVLTHHRKPWTARRRLHPGPERRPTRPGMPDYGEFGRFERLVYAAYVWLILGACCDLGRGATALVGHPLPISSDAVRHLYLLGFITHLIFGMAVRMIPGFLTQRQIASPLLVDLTWWFGTAAAVCRVLLFMVPGAAFAVLPASLWVARTAFAWSGILAWIAVACLATNLWRTVSRRGRVSST
jgi:uncharacterized protein involved in response to NO